MNFKEFATNYLNPIFIMYRAVMLVAAFWLLFLSLPLFAVGRSDGTSTGEALLAFAISIGLFLASYVFFRRRAYLLYLVIPLVLVITAFAIRGEDIPEDPLLFPMAMWWSASFLLAFNGFRSWGYGISGKVVGSSVHEAVNRRHK